MNDESPPANRSLEATSEEFKLLLQLRANPLLGEQVKALADKFEFEISGGMDAHQAEAALIESLQTLGTALMHQWARNTQRDITGKNPALRKHGKKNSSGKPPSA